MADLSSSISRSSDRRPWVLIERKARIGYCRNPTTATGISSFQRIIKVSFELADPPGVSLWFANCHGRLLRRAPLILNATDAFVLLVVSFTGSRKHKPCDDYFIYRAGPGKPSLDLLPRPDTGYLDHTKAGILSLCDGVSKDYAVVIPVLQYDFASHQCKKYDLHVYTKSNKWSTKEAQIAEDTETDHLKLLHHQGTRAISFGGGSLGWVDLWWGILLCNVLDDNPVMRLIQWPVPEPHHMVSEYNLHLDNITPEPFRDVTVVNGSIRFVELKYHPVCGTCKKKVNGQGWMATTWIRMTSSKDWHKLFTVDMSDISLTDSRNPSLLSQMPYQLPEILDESVPLDGVKTLTWDKVISGGPVLSLADDDVVHIMVKLNMEDPVAWVLAVNNPVAWVLAVNTRQNTLEDIQQCSSENMLCFKPPYLPSSFSNYLGTTAVICVPKIILMQLSRYATTEGICKTASEIVTLYRRAVDDFDELCNVVMIGKIISGVIRVVDNLLQSMPSEVLETGKRLFTLTKKEADMW